MGEPAVLTIAARDDLRALNPYAAGRPHFRRIALAIPGLSDADRTAREERLNRHYFACGCGEATAAGLIGLVGYGLWMAARPGGLEAAVWWDAAYLAGAFFLATGIGKWLGRLRARGHLAREVAQLREMMPPPAPRVGPEKARCGVR